MAGARQRALELETDHILQLPEREPVPSEPVLSATRLCNRTVEAVQQPADQDLDVAPTSPRRSHRLSLAHRPELEHAEGLPPRLPEPDRDLGPLPDLPRQPADAALGDEAQFFGVSRDVLQFFYRYVDIDHIAVDFPTQRLAKYFGLQDVAFSQFHMTSTPGWTVITSSPYAVLADISRETKRKICMLISEHTNTKVEPSAGKGGVLTLGAARIAPRALIRCLLAAGVYNVKLYGYGLKRSWQEFYAWPYRQICEVPLRGTFDISRNFADDCVVVFTKGASQTPGFRRHLYRMFCGQSSHDTAAVGSLEARASTTTTSLRKVKVYPLLTHSLKAFVSKLSTSFPKTCKTLRSRHRVFVALCRVLDVREDIGGWRLEITYEGLPMCPDAVNMLTFDFVRVMFGPSTQMVRIPRSQYLAGAHRMLRDISTYQPFRQTRHEEVTRCAFVAYAELLSTFGLASTNIRKTLQRASLSSWRRTRGRTGIPTGNSDKAVASLLGEASEQPEADHAEHSTNIEELNMPLHNCVRVRQVQGMSSVPWVAVRLDGRVFPPMNAKGGRCPILNQLYTYIRLHLPDWTSHLQLMTEGEVPIPTEHIRHASPDVTTDAPEVNDAVSDTSLNSDVHEENDAVSDTNLNSDAHSDASESSAWSSPEDEAESDVEWELGVEHDRQNAFDDWHPSFEPELGSTALLDQPVLTMSHPVAPLSSDAQALPATSSVDPRLASDTGLQILTSLEASSRLPVEPTGAHTALAVDLSGRSMPQAQPSSVHIAPPLRTALKKTGKFEFLVAFRRGGGMYPPLTAKARPRNYEELLTYLRQTVDGELTDHFEVEQGDAATALPLDQMQGPTRTSAFAVDHFTQSMPSMQAQSSSVHVVPLLRTALKKTGKFKFLVAFRRGGGMYPPLTAKVRPRNYEELLTYLRQTVDGELTDHFEVEQGDAATALPLDQLQLPITGGSDVEHAQVAFNDSMTQTVGFGASVDVATQLIDTDTRVDVAAQLVETDTRVDVSAQLVDTDARVDVVSALSPVMQVPDASLVDDIDGSVDVIALSTSPPFRLKRRKTSSMLEDDLLRQAYTTINSMPSMQLVSDIVRESRKQYGKAGSVGAIEALVSFWTSHLFLSVSRTDIGVLWNPLKGNFVVAKQHIPQGFPLGLFPGAQSEKAQFQQLLFDGEGDFFFYHAVKAGGRVVILDPSRTFAHPEHGFLHYVNCARKPSEANVRFEVRVFGERIHAVAIAYTEINPGDELLYMYDALVHSYDLLEPLRAENSETRPNFCSTAGGSAFQWHLHPLENLGQSCFLNVVLQVLAAVEMTPSSATDSLLSIQEQHFRSLLLHMLGVMSRPECAQNARNSRWGSPSIRRERMAVLKELDRRLDVIQDHHPGGQTDPTELLCHLLDNIFKPELYAGFLKNEVRSVRCPRGHTRDLVPEPDSALTLSLLELTDNQVVSISQLYLRYQQDQVEVQCQQCPDRPSCQHSGQRSIRPTGERVLFFMQRIKYVKSHVGEGGRRVTTKIPKQIRTVVEPDLSWKGFGVESLIYHKGNESGGHFISVVMKNGVFYVINDSEVVRYTNIDRMILDVRRQGFLLVAAVYVRSN